MRIKSIRSLRVVLAALLLIAMLMNISTVTVFANSSLTVNQTVEHNRASFKVTDAAASNYAVSILVMQKQTNSVVYADQAVLEGGEYTFHTLLPKGEYIGFINAGNNDKVMLQEFSIVKEEKIVGFRPLKPIAVAIGAHVVLPSSVIAIFDDGANREVGVQWTDIPKTDTSNEYIITGTVKGSSEHVSLQLHVGDGKPDGEVSVSVNAITVSGTGQAAQVRVNQTLQLVAAVTPDTASNKSVSWSVTNENGTETILATISSNGLLTGKAAGRVKATATANDGSGVSGHTLITILPVDSDTPGGGGVAAPQQPAPVVSGGSVVQLVTTDASGKATAEIKAADIQKAVDAATGTTVKIEVAPSAGAKEVQVTLPAQQLEAAADKSIENIEVSLGLARLTIGLDLIQKSVNTSSSKVELSVSKVDMSTLSAQVKEKVGDSTVYDFHFTVDGKKVNGFGNDLRVEVDYTLKSGEDPNKVVIYFIDDKGHLQTVKNGKYNTATGKVEFKPGHFSKYAPAYVKVSFTDIGHVSWAKESIDSLAARAVIDGIGGNDFAPDQKVTRAQFLKMLMQALELSDETAKSALSDVQEGSWYYSSVAAAEKLGIVQGKADGTFGVNEEITREDMAVLAYRAAQQAQIKLKSAAGNTGTFADQSEIAGYAAPAVKAMQEGGILQGVSEGRFAPKGQATRAQSAVVIYKLMNLR
jgi:hypothetical protein